MDGIPKEFDNIQLIKKVNHHHCCIMFLISHCFIKLGEIDKFHKLNKELAFKMLF